MITEILSALLIGVLAALPPGPVLMLVIQKTLNHGRWSGFFTGLGAMVIDTLYAAIGFYALGFVRDFIDSHTALILLAGGAVVTLIGVWMTFRRVPAVYEGDIRTSHKAKAGYAGQAMVCALSNPGALALILGYLAFFGLDVNSAECPVWALLPCIAAGEATYWFCLTGFVHRFWHLKPRSLGRMNRISGIVIAAVGLGLMIKGLTMILA